MGDYVLPQERTAGIAPNYSVSASDFQTSCLPWSKDCWHRVQQTLELIGNKWAVPLVLSLYAHSPLRYSDLESALIGISAKELAKQLKLLEAAGLVQRNVYASKPPTVDYGLTDLGISLQPILVHLANWSAEHGESVDRNRMEAIESQQNAPKHRGRVYRIR